jgi:hypothetical protein
MAVAHPLVVPALLAAGAAVIAYEVVGHVFGHKPALHSGPAKRLVPGGPANAHGKVQPPKKLTPGTSPAPPTTAPANQITNPSPATSITPVLPSAPSPPPANAGGGSSDGGNGGGGSPLAPSGGSGLTPSGPSNTFSPSYSGALTTPDSSSTLTPGTSDGGGGEDDSGGDDGDDGGASLQSGPAPLGPDDDDASSDGSGVLGDAANAAGSAAGSAASSFLSSEAGDDALSSLASVFGPLRGARVGGNHMDSQHMYWVGYQWVTIQDPSCRSSDLPPPPHVSPSSGQWIRYDDGIAHGRPSEDPRTSDYPLGVRLLGARGPGTPALYQSGALFRQGDLEVNFLAYTYVPPRMTLFAWRPHDGTVDKINGYWVYGIKSWSVRPARDNVQDFGGSGPGGHTQSTGAPVFDTNATIPDPPGGIYDSFWSKMFDGAYLATKHSAVDSDAILRSLGIPTGHHGGHWALVHPGYAVWLDWINTADEYIQNAIQSFPIASGPHDPAARPQLVAIVHGGAPPPELDVTVSVESGQGPDVYPAGMEPPGVFQGGMIPPPWATQANYLPGAAYAAQLPAGPVVPFPPPSIPLASQDFLAATNPAPAGAFGDGFAAAMQDDASAVNQPQIDAADQTMPPNYSDPQISEASENVCTLPDGTLGVWCDPANAWTPYYAGVEFGLEPPEGIPVYQDDGSGPDAPPIPVCDLPDGTMGVWCAIEEGWVNYFPGCEFGQPPPAGVPVY